MMLDGNLGALLNLLTIGTKSFVVALCCICIVVSCLWRWSTAFNAGATRHLLWGLVLLPWFSSVAAVFLFMLPERLLPDIGLFNAIHWHHGDEFYPVSWHGLLLITCCTIACFLVLQKGITALKNAQRVKVLRNFVRKDRKQALCSLIDADTPQAFTLGLLRPHCYLTTGLRKRLSKREYDIVWRHELAHAKRYDPLMKYLFSLLAAFFPSFIEKKLKQAMTLAMEQCADEQVLQQIHDKTAISKTIIKVARLVRDDATLNAEAVGRCYFVGNQLTHRIHYLLADDKGRSFPLAAFCLTSLVLICASVFSVDLLHHTVEHFFYH